MSTLYIAHRGFRVGVKENMMEAFELSIKMNVDYIELDVHDTDKGFLVVMHDAPVPRTATVPLLSTVLTACNGRVKFMLDLKGRGTGSRVASLIAAVCALLILFPLTFHCSLSSFTASESFRSPDLSQEG